jgi:Fur family transcriptional regulator, iron response regulator
LVDVREQVISRLEECGIRPTGQRVEIAMLVLTRPCHFSADQLLASLGRAGAAVSKATVYNTLNLFSRKGLVRQIAVDPQRLMYDSTTHPHHHFFCEHTGELLDIGMADLHLSKLPPVPGAMEARSVEVIIRLGPKRAG